MLRTAFLSITLVLLAIMSLVIGAWVLVRPHPLVGVRVLPDLNIDEVARVDVDGRPILSLHEGKWWVKGQTLCPQFGCAVEDLYDFNYEDGELPANAAALQIGYREQGQRTKGKIYVHHIDISSSYDSPFSLNSSFIP